MNDDKEGSVILFFGSSVTSMFSLLYCDSARVNRFPGATAKGLGQGNPNSKSIEHIILKKYANTPIHTLVWMFGSIDVKFSYLFKLCKQEISDPDAMMMSCAINYMNFVRKMHAATNAMTVVIGCEPNGTPPDRVYEQMLKYDIVLDTPENKKKIQLAVHARHPDYLRRTFNDTLKQLCKVNGFHYVDIDDAILKTDALHTPYNLSIVLDDHVDILDICVHLNWEANLMKYIPKLQKLGLQIDDTLDLENTRQEYIHEKSNRRIKKRPKIERGVDDL